MRRRRCWKTSLSRLEALCIPEPVRSSMYPQDVDVTNPLANKDVHTMYVGKIVSAYIIR